MFHGKKIGNLWLFNFLADFSAIVAAYYTTLLIRFHSAWGERFFTSLRQVLGARGVDSAVDLAGDYYANAPRRILFLVVTLCVLYALRDLYPGRKFIRKRPVAWNVVVANAIALALFFAYFYLRANVFHPRSFFVTVIFLNVIYCVGFRALINRFLQFVRSRFGVDQSRAVLVGSSEEADFVKVLIDEVHPHGIDIVERIRFDPAFATQALPGAPPRREASADKPAEPFEEVIKTVGDTASKYGADMVILVDRRLSVAQIMRVLELAGRLDLCVKVLSEKLDVLMNQARVPVDVIRGVPLVHFEAPSTGNRFSRARRAISAILACVVTVVLLPVTGLIALLIRLTSRGQAFFVQDRIGVNRKPFRMYKFRTMRDRADEIQAQVEEFNESGGGLFKIRKDPRVTWIGRFLRRFSLDELPQLINVIRGEMTIVGPRPLPRRDFENYYEDWHYSRHSGMPGLTCLWQVSGRSEIDFHNMCILDVYYLRNQNWVLDLKIVLRTFRVVLFAKGAY